MAKMVSLSPASRTSGSEPREAVSFALASIAEPSKTSVSPHCGLGMRRLPDHRRHELTD